MNRILKEHAFSSSQVLQIVQGDITQEQVDAIVNAANARLQHGGGVAGIISRRGGREIQRESAQWVREHGPVSHAAPAYTSGGKLPCRYVIHTVGPVWGSGDEDQKLAGAVLGSLRVADDLKLKTISLPAISTGIFGFPKDRAARIIFEAIKTYFTDMSTTGLQQVRLVLYDQETVNVFLEIWNAEYQIGRPVN